MTGRRDAATLDPCGTNGAWQRHQNYGEDVDGPCMDAHRTYAREFYRKQRARKQVARADDWQSGTTPNRRATLRLIGAHRDEFTRYLTEAGTR